MKFSQRKPFNKLRCEGDGCKQMATHCRDVVHPWIAKAFEYSSNTHKESSLLNLKCRQVDNGGIVINNAAIN